MGVIGDVENYLCEQCDPRPYSKEIPMLPQPQIKPGCTYYMTLMRDDLQVRIGDCVYLMRDMPQSSKSSAVRPATKQPYTSHNDKYDIFRVEQLWINDK